MASVKRVASSRTVHRCHAGHDIEPPEGYSWAAPGFRARKRYACARHPFRPSQLTTSLRSGPLAAQEALDDALDAISESNTDALDDITTAVEDLRSALEDYAAEREQALDAWENGNAQLEELHEIAQAALDEVDGFTVDEWSGDEAARDRALEDGSDDDEDQDAAEDWRQHVQAQIDAARDLASLEV